MREGEAPWASAPGAGEGPPAVAPARAAPRPVLPQLAARASPLRRLGDAVADAFEHRRLFVLWPFFVIAGLIAYAALPVEPPAQALLAAPLAGLVAAGLAWRFEKGLRPALLVLGLIAGFCLLPLHGLLRGTPMLIYPAFGAYRGVVDEILSDDGEERRIVISAIAPLEGARALPIRRARILAPAGEPLAIGDVVAANLRLAAVPGPILPGSHDSQFHAYFSGIGAYGNVTSDFRVLSRGEETSPARLVDTVRRAIAERLGAHLEGPPGAIARAMVVGDQSLIEDDTREVMALSGLAHIYSISGLHLSIVAGGVFFLVRAAMAAIAARGPPLPARAIAAAAGILAACLYLLLAGGTANVPAFRSTLMLALVFGAVLVGRRALTMRNVAFAALAVLILDPAAMFRPSFQLSFAAVVALIGVYELPRRPRLAERGLLAWTVNAVLATALTSFIAGAATLLFSAYHFQQTAPLGVLANVMAIPLVTLIMSAGVLSVLAMPFGLEGAFVQLLGWAIARLLDIAVLVTSWSAGLEPNPLLTPAALLIGLAGLAWFAFFRTRMKLLGPLLAVPLVLFLGFDRRPDILIADSTQAVAIAEGEGMGLISGLTRGFAVTVWAETYDRPIAARLSATRCDSLGCVYANDNFSLALVRAREGFWEDCQNNDLVITRLPAPPDCRATAQVVDAVDLERLGVHWLSWNAAAGRFDIRTAIPNPDRPWRITAQ